MKKSEVFNKNKKLYFLITAILLVIIGCILVLILQKPGTYLKPTHLPNGITIKDSYTGVVHPSDVRPVVTNVTYEMSNPQFMMSSYEDIHDNITVRQLDCSQKVQDQVCTRKVTKAGLEYFVFDSLNSARNTHDMKLIAIKNGWILQIDIEPPLSDILNTQYDWSDTLDSLTSITTNGLRVKEMSGSGV